MLQCKQKNLPNLRLKTAKVYNCLNAPYPEKWIIRLLRWRRLASGVAGSRDSKESWRMCPAASLSSAFLCVGPSLKKPPPGSRLTFIWTPRLGEKEVFFLSHENPSDSRKSPRSRLIGDVELHSHAWTKLLGRGSGNALISLEPMEGLASSELCWLTTWKD